MVRCQESSNIDPFPLQPGSQTQPLASLNRCVLVCESVLKKKLSKQQKGKTLKIRAHAQTSW